MRGLYPYLDLPRALAAKVRSLTPSRHQYPRRPPDPSEKTETIGSPDCWCGRPQNHDWVGRGEGAPHPRYPD